MKHLYIADACYIVQVCDAILINICTEADYTKIFLSGHY